MERFPARGEAGSLRCGRCAVWYTVALRRKASEEGYMARIKLAYIGGGSTRAPGTMASFVDQGANFAGSEVVLIDLDEQRLALVRQLAQKMVRHAGLDLTVTATTDRRAGL